MVDRESRPGDEDYTPSRGMTEGEKRATTKGRLTEGASAARILSTCGEKPHYLPGGVTVAQGILVPFVKVRILAG
jgi:hypothetical protein